MDKTKNDLDTLMQGFEHIRKLGLAVDDPAFNDILMAMKRTVEQMMTRVEHDRPALQIEMEKGLQIRVNKGSPYVSMYLDGRFFGDVQLIPSTATSKPQIQMFVPQDGIPYYKTLEIDPKGRSREFNELTEQYSWQRFNLE